MIIGRPSLQPISDINNSKSKLSILKQDLNISQPDGQIKNLNI